MEEYESRTWSEAMMIGEDDYVEKMHSEVEPWVKNCLKEGYFLAGKDRQEAKIHYMRAVHPKERGAVVFSHGFCEFPGKYYEVLFYFYRMGYSVFFIQHRGHGLSQRFTKDPDMVHITSYDDYVEDLKEFMDQVVAKESLTKRYLLFAHSMGGAIAALFLEKYPGIFQKAILSSPMMTMNYGGVPDWQVAVLTLWSRLAGWDKRYAPGQHGFDGVYDYEGSSCLSKARYDYIFDLRKKQPEDRMYGGSYGWVRASGKAVKQLAKKASTVETPVLLLQAGRDNLVEPQGQNAFAKNSKHTRLVRMEESKHEIFNATEEIRAVYYREIFTFLES